MVNSSKKSLKSTIVKIKHVSSSFRSFEAETQLLRDKVLLNNAFIEMKLKLLENYLIQAWFK